MKQTVNERVKLLRTSLKLNQVEFANELGISPSLISKIEVGEKPSVNTLDLIIEKYQVPEDWLLHGTGKFSYVKPEAAQSDPWRDVALKEVAGERDNLRAEVKNLWEMINAARRGEISFLRPVRKTAYQSTGTEG